MDRNEILLKLTEIARDIFENEDTVLTDATNANDVDGWDSLTNIQFVIAIEKAFSIRLASREIQSWESVGEIISSIASRNR
ncbi:MAG: acyl carrier protein [Chitinispirillaceae bacterium]|jgi:acyl carrier protein